MMFGCTEILQAIKLDKSNAEEFVEAFKILFGEEASSYEFEIADDAVYLKSARDGTVYAEYEYDKYCVISQASKTMPTQFSEEDFEKYFKCECGNPYCTVPDAQVKLSDSCNGNNCQCCSTTSST